MQGQHQLDTAADLTPGAPSIVRLNLDRSVRTGSDPFHGSRPVDLSVDTNYTKVPRAIYVGTAGNVKVDVLDIDGTTVLAGKLIKAQDGAVLPFACVLKIYSTSNGTTAADLWVGV